MSSQGGKNIILDILIYHRFPNSWFPQEGLAIILYWLPSAMSSHMLWRMLRFWYLMQSVCKSFIVKSVLQMSQTGLFFLVIKN